MKRVVNYSNVIDTTTAAKENVSKFIVTKTNSYSEKKTFTVALDLNNDYYYLVDEQGIICETIHAEYFVDFIEIIVNRADYNLFYKDDED